MKSEENSVGFIYPEDDSKFDITLTFNDPRDKDNIIARLGESNVALTSQEQVSTYRYRLLGLVEDLRKDDLKDLEKQIKKILKITNKVETKRLVKQSLLLLFIFATSILTDIIIGMSVPFDINSKGIAIQASAELPFIITSLIGCLSFIALFMILVIPFSLSYEDYLYQLLDPKFVFENGNLQEAKKPKRLSIVEMKLKRKYDQEKS